MSEAVMQRLKISREGVILIKSFEGFRPRAVRRDDGQWVIGYGHTLSAREGASVSEADAELLLQYDLIPVAKAVNDGVAAALNQHQFDALASFAFSIGVARFQSSDVLSRLNAGFAGEAADAMVGWPEPVLPETALRRRAAERALFVANPAWPVALADLLAAPLPPPVLAPPVVPSKGVVPPVVAPELAPELAEASLEEPVVTTLSPEDVIVPAMQPEGLTTSTPTQADETASSEPDIPSEYVAPDLDGAVSARHAAVASLLAEPAPVLRLPEPAPEPAPELAENEDEDRAAEVSQIEPPLADLPATDAPAADLPEDLPDDLNADEVSATVPEEPEAIVQESAPAPSVTPAPDEAPSPVFTSVLPMQRYSAYAGSIIGPLPAPALSPLLGAPSPTSGDEPAREISEPVPEVATDAFADVATEIVPGAALEASAAAAANPFALPAETANPVDLAGTLEKALPEPPAETPAAATVETPPPFPTPSSAAPWHVDAAVAGSAQADPFPPRSESPAAAALLPETPHVDTPRLELPVFETPTSVQTPDPWPAISATSEPRTDGELLVLSPSPEAGVFASPRLVWPQGEQSGDETPPLFEDDGSLRLAPGNVLRHEALEDAAPARIPWGELTAYGVMGGFGLVSFGMSMAAFRRASQSGSGADGVTLIAIVLAVIGAACVGVSAYNLYRRWGRAEEE